MCVVSQKKGWTALGRDIREVLASYEIPLLQTDIPNRIAYGEAITNGKTIIENQPKDREPKISEALLAEIKSLSHEKITVRQPDEGRTHVVDEWVSGAVTDGKMG